MKCNHCNHENSVLNDICSSCGKPLSFITSAPPLSDPFLEKISSSLDEELKSLGGSLMEGEGSDLSSITPGGHASGSRRGRYWKYDDLMNGAGMEFPRLMPDVKTFMNGGNNLKQIASFVLSSPHVQSNLLYKQRSEDTSFVYLEKENIFNAFATDHQFDGIDADPPMIVIFGGLAHATKVAALALSQNNVSGSVESKHLLVRAIRMVGEKILSNMGHFKPDDAANCIKELGFERTLENAEIFRKARSYFAAMNMGVIAHELGHIALGHTLNTSGEMNYDISRNQEREADSFASSVAMSCPFSDYIVEGGIFWWALMAWTDNISTDDGFAESTHPNSRERLMDYIRANRGQAMEVGADEEKILEYIP